MNDFTVKAKEGDYLRVVRYAMMPNKVVFISYDGEQMIVCDDPEALTTTGTALTKEAATALFASVEHSIHGVFERIEPGELNPYHMAIYQTEVAEVYHRYEERIRKLWDRASIDKVFAYIDRIGEYADWYNGCAEHGYDDKPMICANWNPPKMKRLGDWIEKFYHGNIEVYWSDEWTACTDCSKAVRTSADSHGWQASYVWVSECEILCCECAAKSVDDVITYYLNTKDRALPYWMQPYVEEAGFNCLESEDAYCTRFESGFYPGQNDTPQKCIKLAKEILPYKFDHLFVITGVGQFDIHWAMFIKKQEAEAEVD
jgi:hypothetical protein